jgi:pyridoxine 5-phosphate synthase
MIQLGVNIDHVATLRNVRGTVYPEPIAAALIAQEAGADNITLHLREDRRHIIDRDVYVLKEVLAIPINFEMAVTEEMLHIAAEVLPQMCSLVPEKREELTTEGGLDVIGNRVEVGKACKILTDLGIHVSLFIDADVEQIAAAVDCGAQAIELHTGAYAEAAPHDQPAHLNQLRKATEFAISKGLTVHAGHGLNYYNVLPVAQIPGIEALMIGHAIVARAVLKGMETAVKEMKTLMLQARNL